MRKVGTFKLVTEEQRSIDRHVLTSLLLETLRVYDIDNFIVGIVHTVIFRHEVLPLSSFYLRSSVISIDPFFMSTYAVDLALDPIHC